MCPFIVMAVETEHGGEHSFGLVGRFLTGRKKTPPKAVWRIDRRRTTIIRPLSPRSLVSILALKADYCATLLIYSPAERFMLNAHASLQFFHIYLGMIAKDKQQCCCFLCLFLFCPWSCGSCQTCLRPSRSFCEQTNVSVRP